MCKYMIVRTDNVPTELSEENKLVEGKKEELEVIMKILNNCRPSSEYYFIKKASEKLYNPYREVYGYDAVEPEKVFEFNKKEEKIGGYLVWHNLSKREMNIIKEKLVVY